MIEICDLLSLKEGVEGLDLSKNPITNIGEEIWQNGITSLRAHFKWDKLLPHVRASRGKPMEMINSGKNAPLKKALSVRDKRSM